MIDFLDKELLKQEERIKQDNEEFDEKLNEFSNFYDILFGKQSSNKVVAKFKFNNENLQSRYEELIKAVNNNMPLSFFSGSLVV